MLSRSSHRGILINSRNTEPGWPVRISDKNHKFSFFVTIHSVCYGEMNVDFVYSLNKIKCNNGRKYVRS